jgi:hypothetical protein
VLSRRDRHGRGLRGQLIPRGHPVARGGAQRFDRVVLDVVDHLEWHGISEVASIEFAVEDVPPIDADDRYDEGFVTDADIPLAHAVEHDPATGKPMVVLYRRPVEARANDPDDLVDLVHDLVVDRVAHLLGRDPESLDPHA